MESRPKLQIRIYDFNRSQRREPTTIAKAEIGESIPQLVTRAASDS
jgi:hypothetical protein